MCARCQVGAHTTGPVLAVSVGLISAAEQRSEVAVVPTSDRGGGGARLALAL